MMAKRLLSYPLLAAVLLLAALIPANAAFAERPDSCASEDREIQGNTNSPCKWDYQFDRISSVHYGVVENTEGNTCHEVLIFSPYNSTWDSTWDDATQNKFYVYVRMWWGKKNVQGILREGSGYSGSFNHEFVNASENSLAIIPGSYRAFYSVDSSVPQLTDWGSTLYKEDYHFLKITVDNYGRTGVSEWGAEGVNNESRWLPMPANINDFNLLMNDCLAGIKQRLENEAKLEETRQKVEAERVAQERTAKQAAAEAERQRLETEAAREALRLVRETELAKTQALIEQLEREKIIIGIWQEIVEEKLDGAESRAQITNNYLAEIEANAAEFKASVVSKATEIRRLQEINAAISDAIIAHNDEVERQLEAQAEREAEQRAKLEALHIETPELTPTPGDTPAPTAEP